MFFFIESFSLNSLCNHNFFLDNNWSLFLNDSDTFNLLWGLIDDFLMFDFFNDLFRLMLLLLRSCILIGRRLLNTLLLRALHFLLLWAYCLWWLQVHTLLCQGCCSLRGRLGWRLLWYCLSDNRFFSCGLLNRLLCNCLSCFLFVSIKLRESWFLVCCFHCRTLLDFFCFWLINLNSCLRFLNLFSLLSISLSLWLSSHSFKHLELYRVFLLCNSFSNCSLYFLVLLRWNYSLRFRLN